MTMRMERAAQYEAEADAYDALAVNATTASGAAFWTNEAALLRARAKSLRGNHG